MNNAARQIAIRMALDWAITGLRKLVELLEDTNEQDVADKVDELRKQITEVVNKRGSAPNA